MRREREERERGSQLWLLHVYLFLFAVLSLRSDLVGTWFKDVFSSGYIAKTLPHGQMERNKGHLIIDTSQYLKIKILPLHWRQFITNCTDCGNSHDLSVTWALSGQNFLLLTALVSPIAGEKQGQVNTAGTKWEITNNGHAFCLTCSASSIFYPGLMTSSLKGSERKFSGTCKIESIVWVCYLGFLIRNKIYCILYGNMVVLCPPNKTLNFNLCQTF